MKLVVMELMRERLDRCTVGCTWKSAFVPWMCVLYRVLTCQLAVGRVGAGLHVWCVRWHAPLDPKNRWIAGCEGCKHQDWSP